MRDGEKPMEPVESEPLPGAGKGRVVARKKIVPIDGGRTPAIDGGLLGIL